MRLDRESGEECCNGCCHREMSSLPQSAEPEKPEKNFPKSPCCCQGIWGDILCAKHINLGPTVQMHALRIFKHTHTNTHALHVAARRVDWLSVTLR